MIKKKFEKIIAPAVMALVVVAVALIGVTYFHFISHRISEDSAGHLEEIYSQVNRSFGAFVDRNWGILDGWGDAFNTSVDRPDDDVDDFIERERRYWGYSAFYFLDSDGNYLTPNGETGKMEQNDDWTDLTKEQRPIMVGETLPTGQEITLFASPVQRGTYRGFSFDAIAVSYTNADLANSLDVDAFAGKAKCFVIHGDGSVLLSTQAGGNVFDNYLVYLRAVSDLSDSDLSQMQQNWEAGKDGLLQCNISDTSHFILYQPIGYQDYVLLSVVPQSAVSAGFLSVQRATMYVLIAAFSLVGVSLFALLVLRNRKQYRASRLEIQYRDQLFDMLSNTVDDIFLMLSPENYNVEYVSPNIERLLGITAEEVRGDVQVMKKCAVDYDVVIPAQEMVSIPLQGNRHWECEYMHQTTGERRWYRMTVYHVSIQETEKYIIVLSDRTMEQQMNQRLQEALNAAKSANEAKSNFLSNMSHDIRTPMNAIVGFSVLLEKDADQPEKVREYTRKITASSHHLLSLINDVLDMSKIESGKTTLNVDAFSLPELLDELSIILMPQAKAKEQRFEILVQGAPPEQIIGDKLRLNQILLNLLSNAIKYTPVGGRITFTVAVLPQTTPQYAKLRFVVQDNGIGMSEAFQEQIFAPFSREISSVTNTIQGTGLGMAITKNLVDLMGGIIQVESRLDHGSTFTVELSFALPEETKAETWFHQKITRMLVADDEEEIGLNIREMMRGTGVDVTCVTEGAAAVELAVKAHARGEDFHVILLDWKMPGMDGVATARRIREEIGEHVPILVLTSYDWSEIEEEARAAGINAFLSKPFFTSTFWQAIAPLFRQEPEQAEEATAAAPESVMDGLLFLVAEDNALNAEILTEMLHIEGASCELAVNGQEAVEMFRNAAPGHYDMILMDVQMPVMNGYEATRQIRACDHPEAATIPIAAMTANTFAEDVRDALDAGMDGHLAKPIDMDTVRDLVARLVQKNRPSDH